MTTCSPLIGQEAVLDIAATLAHHAPFWPGLREAAAWAGLAHLAYLDTNPLDITTVRNLTV